MFGEFLARLFATKGKTSYLCTKVTGDVFKYKVGDDILVERWQSAPPHAVPSLKHLTDPTNAGHDDDARQHRTQPYVKNKYHGRMPRYDNSRLANLVSSFSFYDRHQANDQPVHLRNDGDDGSEP